MKKIPLKRTRITLAMMTLAILAVCVPTLIVTTRTRTVHAATTITVTTTSDSGAGSLRQAVADAGSGDTINFNLSTQAQIVLTSGELVINNSITISGPGANQLTVSGNNASRVFRTTGDSVTISGLTLTAGNGRGSDATFNGLGGAVENQGTLALNNCTISSSSAVVFGGAVYNFDDGSCTLTACTMVNNSSGSDGGGVFSNGMTTIQGCTIAKNSGGSGGGGIYNGAGTLAIDNTTISGNTAGNGGGVYDQVGRMTVTNCTITGNRAPSGGGFRAHSGDHLINTIIAGNLDSSGNPSDVANATISGTNSLIGDAGSSGGIVDGVNGNIVGVGGSGTRDITTILNPMLTSYGGPTQTHPLVCGSPALDAGSNSGAGSLMTDQRGAPRVAGGTVDIGAVEMQNQVTNTNDSGSGSLRDAITNATSGEIIDISPCVTGTITLTSGEIGVANDVTINGPGADMLTVSGNNASRTFNASANVEINGLTLTQGNAGSAQGGAVVLSGSGLNKIHACVMSNSSADFAGGLFILFGDLIMNDTTISGNQATSGAGGLGVNDGATVEMTNCTVYGNHTAGSDGAGGLNGLVFLTNCTVSGNSGPIGGGVVNDSGVAINNCIVSGNTGGDLSAHSPNGDNNLVGTNTGDPLVGSNNIDGVDPKLGPLQNNGGPTPTMALLPGSPAIDAGSNLYSPVSDQRGIARPVDGDGDGNAVSDMGAYEAGSCTVTTLMVDPQPMDQAVCAAGIATFTASPSGGGAGVATQWQISTDGGKTFADINGATSGTYSVTGVTAAQNGTQYRAILSNHCGSATSNPAMLLVNIPASVTTSPMSQAVCSGGNATFTAAASGSPAPTVQWQVSTGGPFTNISGATSTTLTINSVTPAQNGAMYQAVFTNSCTAATSSPATLTVNSAPAVTASPSNQTICAGGSVSFTAAASGSPGPTVQWQVSTGGPFTNISSAIGTTLTVNSVTAAQNGNKYQAVFTNGCNTATSSAATLTVNSAPSVTASPSNQTICAGGSVTFTAAASGTPAPTVQWQVSSGGGAFTNISGATIATLTVNSVTAGQNGNRYQAVFTNGCNSATSSAATLTVNTAPVVTTNPVSQSIAASTVTFSAAASGRPTPTVQWQVSTNGGATFANISGAISTTLAFSPTPSQSGSEFRAVFTNGCSTATTSAATLTFYDTCIQDNSSKNTLQLNTTTGEYRFVRCSDGFTITGRGKLASQSGILSLSDRQTGWVISASFNAGQRTGTANIQIISAPGTSQTIRINDTSPANACSCS
jgi:hypothetical protein